MQSDDDRRFANRLRANAQKLMFFANEIEMWLPGDDYTKRREQFRQALEHTRSELLEMIEGLQGPKAG